MSEGSINPPIGIEILNRRALCAKHFDNGDGTFTACISTEPVHYKDDSGEYQDCDLTIIPERNWEFEYAVKKNNFNAYFNDVTDIENYMLASFEIKNSNGVSRWINYKLVNAHPADKIINGNTIKYTEVFDNIDLEYVVNTARLKENIIIKAPVASFSYTFSLKMDGVVLEQQSNGSIKFVDIDTGEQVWFIEAPYAYDANNNVTKAVEYTIGTVTYDGVEYDSITVAVSDETFLSNATYPVVIDPTTNFSPYIEANYYSNQSGWQGASSAGDIYVHNHYDSDASEEIYYYRNCRFDTSTIPDDNIISGAVLNASSFSMPYLESSQYFCGQWGYAWSYYIPSPNAFNVSSNALPISLSNVANISKTTYTWLQLNFTRSPGSYNGSTVTMTGLTLNVTYYSPNTAPSAPGAVTAPTIGSVADGSFNITWGAATDAEQSQASLTYHILLSIDNGGTWPYTVVNNTAAGATSYAYNFTSIPATEIAKLAVRAYDGSVYGNWTYSNTFAIRHLPVWVNVGGAWKKAIGVWVNVSGTWRLAATIRPNVGGAWKSSP